MYLDDVVIGGRDKSEHDERLKEVLDVLMDGWFFYNSDKSFIGQSEIKFMGHLTEKQSILIRLTLNLCVTNEN